MGQTITGKFLNKKATHCSCYSHADSCLVSVRFIPMCVSSLHKLVYKFLLLVVEIFHLIMSHVERRASLINVSVNINREVIKPC